MVFFSLFFVLGVWFLQQQAALPGLAILWWFTPLLPLVWMPRQLLWQKIVRLLLMCTLALVSGFFYAAWIAQQRLADALPVTWQGVDIVLLGVVSEMPRLHERGLSFKLDVETVLTPQAHVPRHISLTTYWDEKLSPLQIHAGERWQFTVRLKQPHGSSNPYNFDFEVWALERNVRAVGYVHNKGDNRRIDAAVFSFAYSVERIRESVRAHFNTVLGDAPYVGVLSALAIGDQGSIAQAQWQVFTRTGVNHLMSISGLHITMLAGFAFALTYGLWRRSEHLTVFLPARKAAVLIGFLVALAYALLAGYGIPAQRTVYMLGTVALALWSSRNIAPSQLLVSALMVVVLIDPWAVISPGFWLSFGAVAMIFYITANRLGLSHWLLEYGRVQWAMSIGLIPLLLALFQQISLVSPLANMFAIPLVSFIVVPLTLLGALLPFDWLLQVAHIAISVCMDALIWLNSFPNAVWTQHAPPFWTIVVGVSGIMLLLLPRGFPGRWLGALLLLPMFMIVPELPNFGTIRLIIFDVGQGLSVALKTRDHALLYDAGPDYAGESDSGSRVLVPALRGLGIARLDGVILSHDDNDHTGGATSVLHAIPVGWVSSSLTFDHEILTPVADKRRCLAGQDWDWDGVHFEILSPDLPGYSNAKMKDNDRSCVLRVSSGKHSVLLAGDIEKKAEIFLMRDYADRLPSTLLVAAHHGSKSSSSAEFVAAVQPEYAIFTAGYRNRFHHPHPDVLARFKDAGSELLRSDEDGAIIVEMSAEKFSVECYRKSHARYWQQPQTYMAE